jgi:hypothetical protein
MHIQANYYQQFDADYTKDVPAEGFGGWKKGDVELNPAHTALVVMHAWDTGPQALFPGWWRCVEYIPRAQTVARTVFPPLLSAARGAGLPVFHVVGGGDYYRKYSGYRRTVELAGPPPPAPEGIEADDSLKALREVRRQHVFVGPHNEADVKRGFEQLDFQKEARPVEDEPIAETTHQLFALCRERGINHLVYIGFAINWCLLLSPGGMADMAGRGLMCSAIRQATTAVENRESARAEGAKELGLWRVALAYGFVFDADVFIRAMRGMG